MERLQSARALQGIHEFVRPLYAAQEEAKQRGKAHSAAHQYSVAMNAAERARKLAQEHGLSAEQREHVVNLAWITGITHDMIRQAKEVDKTKTSSIFDSDGFATALELWRSRKPAGTYEGTRGKSPELRRAIEHLDERDVGSIARAIVQNEKPTTEVTKLIEDHFKKGRAVDAILLDALTFGDKGAEGTGPTVVKRRAEFVSGERHDKVNKDTRIPEDLNEYVLERILPSPLAKARNIRDANQTRLLVYALESLLRIRGLKPVSGFPEDMKPALHEKRKMEIDVMHGALAHLGFKSEKELLDFGLKTKFPYLDGNKKQIRAEIKGTGDLRVPRGQREAAARLVLNFVRAQEGKPVRNLKNAYYSSWMDAIAKAAGVSPFKEIEKRFE